MRASRLLSILLLLQARGRMNAQELADELEVSVRTVYRDVESLGAAGVPIYADRGPAGGYQLVGGYRLRLTGLSGDEAESLFLAGAPGAAAELGLGATLASAQLKLMAALPNEVRASAARIRERFHLDAPAWFQESDTAPHLAAVAEAVWKQSLLRVRYQRAGRAGERMRLLAPLGVVLKAGAWYLVAWARDEAPAGVAALSSTAPPALDATSGDIRVYRVARILDMELLRERFERPAGFDLAAYWRAWSQGFQDRMYHGVAVARLSPRAMDLLAYYLGPQVARAAATNAAPPDADGWTRVTLPIESVEHAVGDFLRFGANAEALAPPELRARLAETSCTLAALYGPRDDDTLRGVETGKRADGE